MSNIKFYGNRLRLLRALHNLSIGEVAKRAGMVYISISRYERGEVQPSNNFISKFSKVFDVKEEFFTDDKVTVKILKGGFVALINE